MISEIEKRMKEAAKALEFEKAAALREALRVARHPGG
jgi:excinuclease UvrABC nuclease subunit